MVRLDDIARFLDHFFAVHRYADDLGGIYQPSDRPVRRLGLALEPWPALQVWTEAERLDALFLHRPWKLPPGQSQDVGVIAYHLAFDEKLALGFNPRLADALGMSAATAFGEKEGRPIGMLGAAPAQRFSSLRRHIDDAFGGHDEAREGAHDELSRIAVVGAMTDTLVREAAARGAHVYVTGQWRAPAARAVAETGIGVVAVGHRRSEEWGLRALAGVVRERWSHLEVVPPPPPAPSRGGPAAGTGAPSVLPEISFLPGGAPGV